MNVKKCVKKIAAVATGALLVSSAFAANLSDWPQPFVTEDGQGDVQFVIGDGSTSDYLGAIDIAVALQAAAVSESSVDVGGKTTTTVEGGYDLSGSDDMFLGNQLDMDGELDESELPELLSEGVVSYDGDDYDSSQTLNMGSNVVEFAKEDKEPMLRVDLTSGDLWTYKFSMDDTFEALPALNADSKRLYEESFSIEMMGKTFTVAEDQTAYIGSDALKLFGSDVTTSLDLNTPVTVDVDGKSYTLEIVGGGGVDSDSPYVTIDVNGNKKNVVEGNSYTIGGLDIYAENVFINTFGSETTASADIFVGSNEIILGKDNEVSINGEVVDGMTSTVAFSADDELESITVTYNPSELNNDVAGWDETEFIEVGSSVSDPLFGTFSVEFVGSNYEMDDKAKAMLDIQTPSDDVELTFETEDGEVTLAVYNIDDVAHKVQNYALDNDGEGWDGVLGVTATSTLRIAAVAALADLAAADTLSAGQAASVNAYTGGALDNTNTKTEALTAIRAKDVATANIQIMVDDIFALNEVSGNGDVTTKIYEVKSIDEEDGVVLKDLATGKEITVDINKEIGESDVDIIGIVETTTAEVVDDFFILSEATVAKIYLKGGKQYFTIEDLDVADADAGIELVENEVDASISADDLDVQVQFTIDADASDDEAKVSFDATNTNGDDLSTRFVTSAEDDTVAHLTEFGTYVIADDEDDDYATAYIPVDEDAVVTYTVILAQEGATVVTSGASGSVTTEKVNAFAVGAAIKDVDAEVATPSNNLIVIGGTCINSVAAKLKQVDTGSCGEDSGLSPNEAIIELFTLDNDKVAMLVAGYDAVDTQAASRAVATGKIASYNKDAVKLTVTDASVFQIE